MRRAYAHNASVKLEPGGDQGAPGAAITVALCGSWEHEPPCPLAPHHTSALLVEDEVRLRTLFAAEPELESLVRQRIDSALTSGRLIGPAGRLTAWQLLGTQRSDVKQAELEHAERLIRNG